VPEIEGSGEIANVPGGGGGGGDAAPGTTAVCADVAEVEPFLFVATTATRKVEPASPAAGVSDEALTPAGTHAPPEASQRCQAIEYVAAGPPHPPGLAES
jgi:hypothetical protein